MTVSELPHRCEDDFDDDSSSESTPSESLDITKDDGWEDVEPEEEEAEPVVHLFNGKTFPDARSMLENCKSDYKFDLGKVQKELGVYLDAGSKLVRFNIS